MSAGFMYYGICATAAFTTIKYLQDSSTSTNCMVNSYNNNCGNCTSAKKGGRNFVKGVLAVFGVASGAIGLCLFRNVLVQFMDKGRTGSSVFVLGN